MPSKPSEQYVNLSCEKRSETLTFLENHIYILASCVSYRYRYLDRACFVRVRGVCSSSGSFMVVYVQNLTVCVRNELAPDVWISYYQVYKVACHTRYQARGTAAATCNILPEGVSVGQQRSSPDCLFKRRAESRRVEVHQHECYIIPLASTSTAIRSKTHTHSSTPHHSCLYRRECNV